ncbi:MAG: hypothetical protein AAF757_31265, partial [Cyanobacteria bacterium P01_D01_bin.116]
NEELDINNNRNEDKTTNISISSYVNGNHESAQTHEQSEAITPVPRMEKQEQHIVPSEETPLTSPLDSNPSESNSQTQPSDRTPFFFQEEKQQYIIPETQSPSTSDDIYPEIITDTTNYLDIFVEPTDTVTQSQINIENNEDVTQEQEKFQEQCVMKIANTVLLIWREYSLNSESIRGKNYDIEFGSEDIILVKRKSGETIAEIPFDASRQPKGIALTEEDISNWNVTQRQIEAHRLERPASRTKRKVVKDKELD